MVKLVFERFTSRNRSEVACTEYSLERKYNRLVLPLFSLQYEVSVKKQENGAVSFTFTPIEKTNQADTEESGHGKD